MSLHALTANPATIPIGASLVVTTSVFFGNVGLSLAGPLPIITGALGNVGIDAQQKVNIWAAFFRRGATLIVGSTAIASTSSALAAYFTRSKDVRAVALTGAVLSASIIPFTLVAIAPTNRKLLAIADTKSAAKGGATSEAEVDTLIRKWDMLHMVRFIGYGGASLAALVALYLERPF